MARVVRYLLDTNAYKCEVGVINLDRNAVAFPGTIPVGHPHRSPVQGVPAHLPSLRCRSSIGGSSQAIAFASPITRNLHSSNLGFRRHAPGSAPTTLPSACKTRSSVVSITDLVRLDFLSFILERTRAGPVNGDLLERLAHQPGDDGAIVRVRDLLV